MSVSNYKAITKVEIAFGTCDKGGNYLRKKINIIKIFVIKETEMTTFYSSKRLPEKGNRTF